MAAVLALVGVDVVDGLLAPLRCRRNEDDLLAALPDAKGERAGALGLAVPNSAGRD